MLNVKQFLNTTFLLALMLVILTAAGDLTKAEAALKDPNIDQLLNHAQKKLDVEYNALLTGDASEITAVTPEIGGLAAERKNDIAETQLRRNKMLADHGQRYSKYISKLTIEKAEIAKENAMITAKENVTLTLEDKKSKEPVLTKEVRTHIFRFVMEGGKWKLVEDSVLEGFIPAFPEVGAEKVRKKPISFDVTVSYETKDSQRAKQLDGTRDNMAIAAATSGTLNRNAAANYARNYWNSYNTGYRMYGNDCTNFTSQALNWAGWQHIGGWYDDPHNWWYSPNPVVSWGGRAEARSWINVHYFYYFARYAGRVNDAQYIAQFDLGDNLHIDFGAPDGILDHNTIVTKNNGGGNIFLTYHSVNTLDISIWDLVARTPGANYYGSLMRTSY